LQQLQNRCEDLHEELDDPIQGQTQAFFQQWKKRYDALIQDTSILRLKLGETHGARFEELCHNFGKLQLDFAQARDLTKVARKVEPAAAGRGI